MSGATPPPETPLAVGTRYRVSRCRLCGVPILAAGARGPRRSICEKPDCRHTARAEAYVDAAIREHESAGNRAAADELREFAWRRVAAAINRALDTLDVATSESAPTSAK
jgi:hypothetical protein